MPVGEVYLVGAGCGRADLITVRGLRLLERCDAVVYDDLIDPALLEYVPAGARTLYMGKRSGHHSAPQEEIAAALIALAQEGLTVVRLKGGDPFVFGRGGEEMLALKEAGIPCEEVPGISSAIAIPAAAGILVTHRRLSRSFHVITGHTADTSDGLPRNLEELAKLEGTLVFLMGLGRLEAIARRLMEGGRRGDTPAAVLSGGNSLHPAVVRGTLETIAQRAAGVRPPAVIVVGETAALDLSPTVFRPLSGVRVGITGTEQVAGRLKRALEELGAFCLRLERPEVERLDWPLEMLDGPGSRWLVFTSANGVRAFFRRLREARRDVRTLGRCSVAVIGRATGAALEHHGIQPDLCPAEQTSRGLAQALIKAARPGEEMVLLRSEQGSRELPRMLEEAGLPVRDVATYRVTEGPCPAALPPLDCLTFASAGGVERFLERYGGVPEGCPCVCIGEVTAAALEGRTAGKVAVARDISVEGLAQAVLELLGRV